MRGAKQLVLLPGFESQTGSVSDFYVKDYFIECNEPASEEYHYATITSPVYYPLKSADSTAGSMMVEMTTPVVMGEGPYISHSPGVIYPEDSAAFSYEGYENMLDSLEASLLAGKDTTLISLFYEYTGRAPRATAKDICNYMTLYPNPATGDFTVHTAAPGDYLLNIFDMAGRKVWSGEIKGSAAREISLHAPPGTYVVQITGQHVACKKKITIIH